MAARKEPGLRTDPWTLVVDLIGGAKASVILARTANGRPFAVMTPVSPETVEGEIQAIRRARTRAAIEELRAAAKSTGVYRLTMEDIDAEIAAARRARRKRK